MIKEEEVLIVGLGKKFRGDDYLGHYVISLLKEELSPKITFCRIEDDYSRIIPYLENKKLLIIIDAVSSHREEGYIHSFSFSSVNWENAFSSTHSLNLKSILEMAKVIYGYLPRVVLYGVEVKNITPGEGLSEIIKKSSQKLSNIIFSLIDEATKCTTALP